MNKYTPTNNIITNEILNTINDVMSNNPDIPIHLSEIALIIKYSFKENSVIIKSNGKLRNVTSYIKNVHTSLSNFIRTKTKYEIENNELISRSSS